MSKSEPIADLDSIKADIAALRDDLTSVTSSLLHDGAKSVQHAAKVVRDTAVSATDQMQELVGKRPLISILIAFGAGVLVAKMLRRS